MPNTLNLLTAMIAEDKITITEVLEACGYKVDVVCTDNVVKGWELSNPPKEVNVEFGYDEKIIATKEFR